MITITLTFTTLNAALRALREIPENVLLSAPVTHSAAVSADEKAAVLEAPGKSSPAKTARGKPTAEVAVAAAPEKTVDEPASQPAAASVETAHPASTAADEPAFEYGTLAAAVNAAVPKHGKAKLLAIAAKHGAENFKALAASAWAAAHADVVALG